MDYGAYLIDAIADALPEAAVTLAFEGDEVSAVSHGFDRTAEETEQGTFGQAGMSVRYKLTDEPAAWTKGDTPYILGKIVEVDDVERRVTDRIERLGMVRLELEADNA